MLPPAPPTFSTTTVCPSAVPMRCAMIRAMESVEPPGGNGLTSVTVRVGNDCAAATTQNAETSSPRKSLFILCTPAFPGDHYALSDRFGPGIWLRCVDILVRWCYFPNTNGKYDNLAETHRRTEGKGGGAGSWRRPDAACVHGRSHCRKGCA